MATDQSGGIDPRFPEAYQRGGAYSAPVLDEGIAVRGAGRASASLSGVNRARRSDAAASQIVAPRRNGRDQHPDEHLDEHLDERLDGQRDHQPNEQHFELIVAGNPWLRSLWVVGVVATIAGFALTVYAEFAFSVPPASGIYGPSVYIVPRIAEAVAQPLVIAGVISLVAATALRIVAWRPSRVTAVIVER